MVKGTVSISLEDFKRMEKAQEDSRRAAVAQEKASKELGVFMNFLKNNIPDMQRHIEQFNKQSTACSLIEMDGRLKMVLKV